MPGDRAAAAPVGWEGLKRLAEEHIAEAKIQASAVDAALEAENGTKTESVVGSVVAAGRDGPSD